MRFMPLITATVVSVALYALVFEREALMVFAQVDPSATDIETEEEVVNRISVVTMTSVAETVDSAVILRGRTEAARQVTVASETSGLVISEPIRKGAFVEEGALLCQLDPGTRAASLAEARARLAEAQGRVPEAQATVIEANARVREAEINVNVARQLSEDGFASETRLISAEAALEAANAGVQRASTSVTSAQAGIEAAQAGVAAAEREIERLNISAPFAGLLESDTTEIGSLMQPGAPCATIIQLDPIKLVGFVPETNVGQITVGAMAGARLATGEEVVGEVTFLSRSADELTRTFRVEVRVPNADLHISDGQTAEILVASDGRKAHLLPGSALTLDNDGNIGVRVVGEGNIARFLPISVMRDTIDGIWVTGLPETVDVIVVGQEYVTDGVPVEPTMQEADG
ncbi:membrane fusion protein, multidrug efflux system [Octadecabacter temperatus]|uniref:Multidrug resistance protein MdtA n=1 Tax=Octadecabacter temperatus TaxID=1458307 RepID=A0A0K0Y6S0_9RHOB|nr:efflux RND transporter periplasmic adaptor subunit [Octadecabacter temperatus]AKS46547.1 Multidrug resistance protein MdtA precursor [Octadecabacter temperatus]SIO16339.1 membrane fusion protein, multidrug efflux system [Octadecabacter temperatus]